MKPPSSPPSADDPKALAIGFTVREYNGCPVYAVMDGKMIDTPLTRFEDVVDGTVLAVPSFRGGYFEATAYVKDGRVSAQTEHVLIFLDFDKDDRHCWICTGMANTRALKKLTISRSS